jgi:hypothetical protein
MEHKCSSHNIKKQNTEILILVSACFIKVVMVEHVRESTFYSNGGCAKRYIYLVTFVEHRGNLEKSKNSPDFLTQFGGIQESADAAG